MRIMLAAAVALATGLPAFAQDIEGSADHPLIPRYEGAEIVAYEAEAFNEHRMLVAPTPNYGGLEANFDATERLEGAVTRITYRGPEGRSALEVFRNYETALADAGFVPVFTCQVEECGGRNFNHSATPTNYYMGFGEYYGEQRYLAARLSRPEGDVHASVYVVTNRSGGGPDMDRPMIQLNVVESEAMEERMVLVEAAAMKSDLETEGRVAIYGIHFDVDEDAMREESRPQLDEIARLLRDAPQMNVLIVGHTDAQGAIDYNLDLSQRRARSVVDNLVLEYGVDASRLTPVGVGMAAPVASNRTDDGMALNRRVELVER